MQRFDKPLTDGSTEGFIPYGERGRKACEASPRPESWALSETTSDWHALSDGAAKTYLHPYDRTVSRARIWGCDAAPAIPPFGRTALLARRVMAAAVTRSRC